MGDNGNLWPTFMGAVCVNVASFFFTIALNIGYIGPVIAMTNLQTILSVLLLWLIAGETPSNVQWLCMSLATVGAMFMPF
mmetsp:Transcript_27210/g.59791  ORF Transcript_27210/g.59791 Transcript_27210/m.59791 type:complete len:80 (+) Transcript_27210:774-1013(+)